MSLAEHTHRFERSLHTTAELLQKMLRGLQERRTSWISARPSTMAPSTALEEVAMQLAAEEHVRARLLEQIAPLLPLPAGVAARDLHVNVTRLVASLPDAAARSLRAAADLATGLARKVRGEVTLGGRLLKFSQRAQDGFLTQLATGSAGAGAAAVYDRNARARSCVVHVAGSLIDGRL
jgi:hypothetical protein